MFPSAVFEKGFSSIYFMEHISSIPSEMWNGRVDVKGWSCTWKFSAMVYYEASSVYFGNCRLVDFAPYTE